MLIVVPVPMDAYNGINADVEVIEKLPGMRLLMDPVLSVALTAIVRPFEGIASIVTFTALLALEPSYMESRLIDTVIVLQQSLVSVLLALRAVASDANVPKLLCEMQ